MITELKPGAQLDLLTKDELAAVLKSWSHELTRGAKYFRRSITGTVTAAGVLLIEGGPQGFEPAPGFTWAVTRLTAAGLTVGQSVAAYANDANPSSLLIPELDVVASPAVLAVSADTTVGADPAAGAEMLVTVPAGETWDLQTVHVALVTDATVANRRVNLRLDDGANVFATMVAAVDQAASTTVTYSFIAGGGDYAAVRDGKLQIGLPAAPMRLGPGYRIRTTTTNLQAGDNYAAPVVSYTLSTTTQAIGTDDTDSLVLLPRHALILQESDQLVIAGTGLTSGATVTITAQIKEVPSLMAWSL